MSYSLDVNGKVLKADVDGEMPLLWVLRDTLGMTGTKFGCGAALCGACTVHVDGLARRSCVMPVSLVRGGKVKTIEGLSASPVGRTVQQAWLDLDVAQCGYCQSGQLMQATALLEANPNPSDEEIAQVMAGNICRCGTYDRIRAAIRQAAQALAQGTQRGAP
ncbi:(2Fe-2S)-binding protein [Duganella callida]|uniref:(2Fe-2S)-binding protein n=1 Tax=Duganella callida TaxID=2561932 RepID=A0A4Y9SXL4_9BURK|nr:(2Fe-2S)-binding protein [Duganella callida]TFW29373.1 (2Fe-2S)-binding protein [Duganella callida]